MPAPYTGGCLCGSVRYTVNDEPLTLYACHCSDCQRRTGSAFALSLFVRRSGMQLDAGTTSACEAVLGDGRVKRAQLCAHCGTRLWAEPVKYPELRILQAGTLDDTRWLQPVAHVWARSAQPWFMFPPGVPVYPMNPDDPKALFTLWQARQG